MPDPATAAPTAEPTALAPDAPGAFGAAVVPGALVLSAPAAEPLPASWAEPRTGRRRPPARSGRGDDPALLLKAVNTLAIVPKSARITTLGRKTYNVLLFQAQEQGLERDVFRAPLDTLIKGLEFDSHDHALIKKHLRAMVSTTVEWQSPTTGEGSTWNVSGLLAHAKLSKEGGQVWVEWSYAVNLKQELLEPTVFARLRLEVISQLRSHAAVALYEICTRYKDIGRTARQAWRWWYPVLSGNPPSDKLAKLEYRIFKRDTLKPAIAEVSAITDIEVELVEHKQGRFIDEIQFRIQPKRQASLALTRPPQPVDLALVARAQRLGLSEEAAEDMIALHGDEVFRAGLDSLERRLANSYPEPLRDPTRYLRALMPGEAARAQKREADRDLERGLERERGRDAGADIGRPVGRNLGREGDRPGAAEPARGARGSGLGNPAWGGSESSAALRAATAAEPEPARPAGGNPRPEALSPAARDLQAKRQARWRAEWTRRRHEQCAADIEALSAEAQRELEASLMAALQERQAHPSLTKRLAASGWQHPMVRHEMLRHFGAASYGPGWDQPSAEQLLAIAAEMGAERSGDER